MVQLMKMKNCKFKLGAIEHANIQESIPKTDLAD